MDKYKLDATGDVPVLCSLEEWAQAFDDSALRIVDRTKIGDDTEVSTVFLGLDHSWGGLIPMLWESLVFGGPHDGLMNRCGGVREDAQNMHEETLAEVYKLMSKQGE